LPGREAVVFFSILYRTILWELFRVFALSLLGITGLILMAGIIAEASQRGLAPSQIFAIIPLLIPSTLPYTIPATTLLATCMVYGRLAHDNEILAIKAAGINVMKVVSPGIFLGLFMSCTTMALYYDFIPRTHHMLRTMFLNDVEELLYSMLRRDHCINLPRSNYSMWVKQVYGKRLQDAIFKRRDAKGNYDIIAKAKYAELRVDVPRQLVLVHMRFGEVSSENGKSSGYFENKVWDVPMPESPLAGALRRPRALGWPEIFERKQQVFEDVANIDAEIATTASRLLLDHAPADLPKHLTNLNVKRQQVYSEIYALNAELMMRPALCFGCLCFALVGCPVGIWFSKSDYLSAFITCFLPIVTVYYPLLLCGTNMAKDNKIHPLPALWAANAVMGLIAIFLFRKLMRN
jgi:lipopolysaccharide export system permease protein